MTRQWGGVWGHKVSCASFFIEPRAWVEGRVMDAYMARLVLAARGRGRRVGGASVHLVARAGNLLAFRQV